MHHTNQTGQILFREACALSFFAAPRHVTPPSNNAPSCTWHARSIQRRAGIVGHPNIVEAYHV